MITIKAEGSFNKTQSYLNKLAKADFIRLLEHYAEVGLNALASMTPVDTGRTAASWYYEIEKTPGKYSIVWRNVNVNNGAPIAILIQYGHATGTGGWVEGRDYINSTIQPIFDQITAELWKQVTRG